jgi:hypothetical protein
MNPDHLKQQIESQEQGPFKMDDQEEQIELHLENTSDETNDDDELEKYLQLKWELRELEDFNPGIRQRAFGEEIKRNLFNKFPELTEISWVHESDYFNDGDSTPFRSNHTYPRMNGEDWFAQDDPMEKVYDAVCEYMKETYSDGDILSIFGDNMTVTITRDGITTKGNY